MNKKNTNLVTVDELSASLNSANIRVIDASWYLPNQARNCLAEYQCGHIPGATFFDIDAVSDHSSDLPHMLPSADVFSSALSEMGISNQADIVVYDSAGLFSAARVWWMFKVFGHESVRVLNGGLPAWKAAGHATSDVSNDIQASAYKATFDAQRLKTKPDMLANAKSGECLVLDARPLARFLGQAPEPRAGLPSGHMPHSVSLPFNELLHDGHLKSSAELRDLFSSLKVDGNTKIITSCGSGVTAAIITLALSEAGLGLHSLYDGAWAEWASADDAEVLTE